MTLTPKSCPCCGQTLYDLAILPMEAQGRIVSYEGRRVVFKRCVDALALLRSKMQTGWRDRDEIDRVLGVVDAALSAAESLT